MPGKKSNQTVLKFKNLKIHENCHWICDFYNAFFPVHSTYQIVKYTVFSNSDVRKDKVTNTESRLEC